MTELTPGDPGIVRSWHGAFALVPENLLTHDLSGRALRTYIGLALYADREGASFPSLAVLAGRTGQSVRNVQRGLRELREAELLEIVYRVRPHSSNMTNIYQLRRP